jgi:hypothetical protein
VNPVQRVTGSNHDAAAIPLVTTLARAFFAKAPAPERA